MSARWSAALRSRVLFRGHVVRRAYCVLLVWRAVAPQHLGDAEVGDFHLAGLVEQQVLRLDVAVDDWHDRARTAARRKLAARWPKPLSARAGAYGGVAQVHAVNILHQQIKQPVGLSEVVDRDNVRMTQLCECLGLASEAFGELRIFFSLGARGFSGPRAGRAIFVAPCTPPPYRRGPGRPRLRAAGNAVQSLPAKGTLIAVLPDR